MQPTAGLSWGVFYPGNRLWLIPGLLLDPPWESFIVNGFELTMKIPITYKWNLLILFFRVFTHLGSQEGNEILLI